MRAGKKLSFPEGKEFAFTIFDDTDRSTVANTKPVYDFLARLGFRTTKTVWPLPPAAEEIPGEGHLGQDDYRGFVRDLMEQGFEIAFHGARNGSSDRQTILRGWEEFSRFAGAAPCHHVNHAQNRDNIYWGSKRFVPPFRTLYSLFDNNPFEGECSGSEYYWGDIVSSRIRYTRHHSYDHINTLRRNPWMPYIDPAKPEGPRYWYGVTDAPRISKFNQVIHPGSLKALKREGGVCIVYAHLADGFFDEDKGRLDPRFEDTMSRLAEMNGWFVPVTPLLDHIREQREKDPVLGYFRKSVLDFRFFRDRIVNRLIKGKE